MPGSDTSTSYTTSTNPEGADEFDVKWFDPRNESNDTDDPSDPVLSADARDTGQVSVFPNPVRASSQIVLRGVKPGHYTVELRDVHGRSLRIDEKMFRYDRELIRIGSITPGIYLLKLYGNSTTSYSVKVQVVP